MLAKEQHGIEFFGRHVAQRRIIALLVLLAGGEGEAQCRRLGCGLGRRARAADRARLAVHCEAIPVGPIGPEAGDIDMHRMRPARQGGNRFVRAVGQDEPMWRRHHRGGDSAA